MSDNEKEVYEIADDDIISVPKSGIEQHFVVYIIPRHLRKTSNVITQEEWSNLISTRAAQIAGGAKPYINCEGIRSERNIAILEMLEGQNPLIVSREVCRKKNYSYVEHFEARNMAVAHIDRDRYSRENLIREDAERLLSTRMERNKYISEKKKGR